MNIRLGNITFNQVEEKLGYRLTDADREVWNKYHNDNADLIGMDNCFHVYDMPKSILFKGDETGEAILKMFTPEKMVQSLGAFPVNKVKR